MSEAPDSAANGHEEQGYDFGGAVFDLGKAEDCEVVRFVLSQALYGEATGVYCGRSLYAARSLEAARFYARQAHQELNHLRLFADIFRLLELKPQKAHWVVRLLSSHNDYYPLKVLLEHAIGEGMVHDIFKDVLLQTLPDSDPRVHEVKKKLRAIVREEVEHVAWGEKETKRIVQEQPRLRTPFYGLVLVQMAVAPRIAMAYQGQAGGDHPVMKQLPAFVAHVRARVLRQGRELGFVPEQEPGTVGKTWAVFCGALLYLRSKFARSRSRLEHIYIEELGFGDEAQGQAAK